MSSHRYRAKQNRKFERQAYSRNKRLRAVMPAGALTIARTVRARVEDIIDPRVQEQLPTGLYRVAPLTVSLLHPRHAYLLTNKLGVEATRATLWVAGMGMKPIDKASLSNRLSIFGANHNEPGSRFIALLFNQSANVQLLEEASSVRQSLGDFEPSFKNFTPHVAIYTTSRQDIAEQAASQLRELLPESFYVPLTAPKPMRLK